MAHYEYKTVAGPVLISVRSPDERASAVKSYEQLINSEAVDGWEFYSTDEFETTNPTGCFGTGPAEITSFKMLIFRRAKA